MEPVGGRGRGGGENQLTGTWAREQGLGVGRGAGGKGGGLGRAQGRRTGGRETGGGGLLSTTDPGAGAGHGLSVVASTTQRFAPRTSTYHARLLPLRPLWESSSTPDHVCVLNLDNLPKDALLEYRSS